MALLHQATITPSKLELVRGWLPGRSWYPGGPVDAVRQLGAYRFDDPAGEVGVETLLLAAGDVVLQVPLTYRHAPVEGADGDLVGTAEHSVLGTRWVYDGCADPVWAGALGAAVIGGGTQASEEVDGGDGLLEPRPPTATVQGSGTPGTPVAGVDLVSWHDEGPVTVVRAGLLELLVARVAGTPLEGDLGTLTGTWPGSPEFPVTLATIRATTD